ncbi:Endonuclease I [Thalassobacillus cyri]|uniref:Endonuclease I n=1 Tax=Thalassobacillus cyri TaxID=571932 RepID=A0A1H3XQB7_9BACI|nr:endonuclease [Thalassobacillus cyri]SEA00784.1 Endonuclease I [Thalassobacillus cyri]
MSTFNQQLKEEFLSVTTDRTRIYTILSKASNNKTKVQKDEKSYYDEERDRQSIAKYYRDIDFDQEDQEERFQALGRLLEETHTRQVRYDPSEYVYPWVDLRPDGTLRSVYSGQQRDAEEVIKEDYETSLKRTREIEKLEKHHGGEKLAGIAAAFKYNCEHTVPQSWYDAKEPMRGDIHQLFTCDPVCNSIRSNYPYHDFPNYDPDQVEASRIEKACGKAEDGLFEPEHAKGAVARAMLYFLLRYPDKIEASHLKTIDIELLQAWHQTYPPTIYERHRNQAIQEIQGNRNPYIDFPDEMTKRKTCI